MTLPEAYGGGGKDAFHRFVLAEELLCRGAPVSAHWIADRQSGPLILKYGTAAQRDFFLPKICKAELFFCIGMSEPQSGSDLAGLRTRATRTAEGWVLKGQKLWTTNAHRAHYMIALVRSSGTPEDRHQGLSQMIIDLSLPGITVRTIGDLTGDQHFNEVFFDDVLLPPDALIGEEGAGWAQVTAELAFERSGPERIYGSMVLFDAWLQQLRSRSAPTPAELALAGRVLTQLVPLREMSVALTAKLAQGESPVIEAALVKDLGTELEQAIPNLLADALAADPQAERPEDLLRTLSYVLQVCPTFSLRGGTREILRGVIARGLGLR
jgi:alkylation response protein AidB-like acyl-CoA dehydrogenase